MKLYVFITLTVFACLIVDTAEGCHRRKRSTRYGGGRSSTAKQFMSSCIPKLLKNTPGYEGSDWSGPVSYTIFHSKWYEDMDLNVCAGSGAGDNVKCWVSNLSNYISGSSPALRAAQVCVKLYYDQFIGRTTKSPYYPKGYKMKDYSKCAAVDYSAYKQEFLSEVDSKDMNDEDDCIKHFGSVVRFAKRDMICRNCACSRISQDYSNTDPFEYYYADGRSCGGCWTSRLASGTRSGSRLRGPAAIQAIKRAGLRRKLKSRGSSHGYYTFNV